MKKHIYVSVSTDPISSYQEILDYSKEMEGKADFLHCDVMDGLFVGKETFDYSLIGNINMHTVLPLDVHLMVDEPLKVIPKYIKAGANIITIHYEAFKNKEEIPQAIELIKSHKALAGLSFKPGTPFKEIKQFCFGVDVLLVMTVEPGKSGQKFITESYKKIKEIDAFRLSNDLNFKIEVDGGVGKDNAKMLTQFGVDVLVSGSYVYNSKNRLAAIEELRGG